MTNHDTELNYPQAWRELGDTERRVLLLMLLALESGSDFEYLAAVGAQADNLAPIQIRNALEMLISRSLVISHDDPPHHRYAIHPQTRDFLHKQVLNRTDDD